jgi:hypothetical protein
MSGSDSLLFDGSRGLGAAALLGKTWFVLFVWLLGGVFTLCGWNRFVGCVPSGEAHLKMWWFGLAKEKFRGRFYIRAIVGSYE